MSSNTLTTPGDAASAPAASTSGDQHHVEAAADSPPLAPGWRRLERTLARASDWLNPILVKETRQALKSFQFTITFILVLVACWIATIGGVAYIGPRIYYSADGGTLLLWYYAVLAFPLIVVVPYAAFRSLASEREDNTYDLLSITALKPRQIISGKLGSSVVQMAVYFSAIMPCLAFTYLLRGVDLPTILILSALTFLWSLGLSILGILLATLSEHKFSQVFVSVALVAFLLLMFYAAMGMAFGMSYYSFAYIAGEEFWSVTGVLVALYLSTFALAFFAAAGMITFSTENRSTPLRLCMLVQQAVLVGLVAAGWIADGFNLEGLLFLATLMIAYWYVMGTMLTAEHASMSRRVMRRLPKSFIGRMFCSWLYPGPGAGFMFVVSNASAIVAMCLLGVLISLTYGNSTTGWVSAEDLLCVLLVGWGYLVAYLGFGMMIIRVLRRFALVTMLASVLIHFLLLLAGSGIPTAIQLMSVDLRYVEYSLLQITNPFWSLVHLSDGGMLTEANVLVIAVPAAALCAIIVNLLTIARELAAVRIHAPRRVLEDDSELRPQPESGPANPWDE